MKFYWIKTNQIIKKFFGKYVWDIPNTENKVFLTFDDGPTPVVTQWVLHELAKYNCRATFFCIGKNIEKHLDIFNEIIKQGHSVGNHTHNHLNGWKTTTKKYIDNVMECENRIPHQSSKIFRPPYGKISNNQSKKLIADGYKIIMWDVLSADFDTTITPNQCTENVLKNLKTGSILVFHDSKKAEKNLRHTLPKTLKFIREKGFVCEVL